MTFPWRGYIHKDPFFLKEFIYLCESQTYTEKRRDTQGNLPSTDSHPRWLQWCWAGPGWSQVPWAIFRFPVVTRGPSSFPQATTKELDWKWSGWNMNWHPHGFWHYRWQFDLECRNIIPYLPYRLLYTHHHKMVKVYKSMSVSITLGQLWSLWNVIYVHSPAVYMLRNFDSCHVPLPSLGLGLSILICKIRKLNS